MVEEEFAQVLEAFDLYLTLLESPLINQKMTTENISKAFDCCLFIEVAVTRAKDEDKVKIFEDHLHGHWKQKNRTRMYSCSELQLASDKMLEVFLKSPGVSTDVVDKLLQLYVQHCGRERLGVFFENVLMKSWSTNVLLNSLVELGLPISTIEDDARLIVWNNEAACGNLDDVYKSISQMIDDGQIKKVFQALSTLNKDSPARKLIIKNLTQRANDYDVPICLAITEVSPRLLRELMEDVDFQISFLDAVFYFGRNMNWDGKSWKAEHSFTYQDLMRIMRNLLTVSDQVHELINDRLQFVKTQMDGSIWVQIEKDCIG